LIFQKTDTSLAGFNPGLAGSNIVWDFSALDFNHPSIIADTVLYISPAGTPFYPTSMTADYSQSNFCYLVKTNPASPNNFDYNYCYADNDSISFIGHWADGGGNEIWEDHCTDFIKLLSFPFTFQDNFIDSFERFYFDMSGSDAHYITGTHTLSADGYGSFITPDGNTIDDVLRLHSVESVRDSNLLFGITNRIQHNYYWYSSNQRGFILRLEMNGIDSTTISSAYYQRQTNVNTSLSDIDQQKSILHFYPNPGNGHFEIFSEINGDVNFEIYNSTGKTVSAFSQRMNKGNNVTDLSFLNCGIYFVNITSARRSVTEKIFIE
jgi:hypothetical protein